MELDIGFLGAFVAGLVSFASPCVLPLVPPYLAFLAGVSLDQLSGDGGDDSANKAATRRVVIMSLAFVAGFSTVFVALGASASFIGDLLTEYLTILGYVAGAIILVLGLHFLGVFRIGLLFREARFQVQQKPLGLFGSYVVGLAFAFGWTPCVGPVLAAILLYAGSEAEVTKGALLLLSYALGIGVPFIITAFFVGPFLRLMAQYRRHMGKVEKIMGVMLVITGILFLTNSMSSIAYWMLEMFPSLGTVG